MQQFPPIVNEYDYKGFHVTVTFRENDAHGRGSFAATAYDVNKNPVFGCFAVKGVEDIDQKIKAKIDNVSK